MTNNFEWYKGNLLWLPERTIFLSKYGSHAYGTNIETSDIDIRGVCIPPKEYFLGFVKKFEQAEAKQPYDVAVHDIRKFFALATKCNPNIIELLYIDPSDWYFYKHPWTGIVENRHLFLSKKARFSFSGYAMSQLKRIETHRRWILNPPKKKPDRADFGLPYANTLDKKQLDVINAKIRKDMDKFAGEGRHKAELETVDEQFVEIAVTEFNLDKNIIPIVLAERRFGAAARNWEQYETWKLERNPVRSELEAKFGYDTKHAGHLVRLMRMCKEIMTTGVVNVKRPDAEEIKSIRSGA